MRDGLGRGVDGCWDFERWVGVEGRGFGVSLGWCEGKGNRWYGGRVIVVGQEICMLGYGVSRVSVTIIVLLRSV